MSNNVRLRKGSGFAVSYSTPDVNGYYTPDSFDRSALQQVGASHWREIQPDGYELHFDGATVPAPAAPVSGVGCVGNLIGQGYATPYAGVPLRLTGGDGLPVQPDFCRIDQEIQHGFDVASCGVYGPTAPARPWMSPVGNGDILDHAMEIATQLCAPFNLPVWVTGGDCGIAGLTCRFHYGSGNLLLSFSLPRVGAIQPPIRFFYNSLIASQSEFGYGWSCLWQQVLEDIDPQSNGGVYPLSRVSTSGGITWSVSRTGGLIDTIVDPQTLSTQFSYASGRLTAVNDTAGRTTTFAFDGPGNLTHVGIAGTATIGFQYDGARLLTAVQAADGKVSRFGYDSSRRVTAITSSASAITQITYGSATSRTVIDPRGGTWSLSVDADQNVTQAVTPVGATLAYTWDATTQRLTSASNGILATTTFQYATMSNYAGRLADIIRPISQLSFTYDAGTGDLTAVTDEAGFNSSLSWSGHRRTTFVNANGASVRCRYNGFGHVRQALDGRGQAWNWSYDPLLRVATASDPTAGVRTFSYNSQSQISAITEPDGTTTQYRRDALNRATATVDAGLNTSTLAYDAAGRVTATVDVLGEVSTFEYDDGGRVTHAVEPAQRTWSYSYDAGGNCTVTIDPRGGTSTCSYDACGQQTHSVDPMLGTKQTSYDDAGRCTLSVDEDGGSWSDSYDDQDRLTQSTDPAGNSSYQEYDAAGQCLTRINEAAGEASFGYDRIGRATRLQDEEGYITQEMYDENGNITTTIRPDGVTTSIAYDGANRATAVTTPLGTSFFAYDAASRRTSVTDAAGRTTTTRYSAMGAATKVVDGAGGTWLMAYDAKQRLTQSTNPRGGNTSFSYDAADRRTAAVDADGGTWAWHYDTGGNVTLQVDPRLATAAFAYDGNNRRIAGTWSDGRTLARQYDAAGRCTRSVDAHGTSTISYDNCGRPIARSVPQAATPATFAYDDRGLVTAFSAYGAGTFTYGYDARGLPTEVVDPGSNVASFAYDAMRRVTEQTLGNGGRTTLAFHVDSATHIEHYDPAGTLLNAIDAGYNGVGRRTLQTETDGTTTAWSYDGVDRLTAERRTRTATTIFDVSYAYDAAGNRTAMTDGTASTSYAYTLAGRLTQAVGAGPVTTTFAYDAAGHRTSQATAGATSTFDYDAAGRLRTATRAGGATTLDYDAGNRLVRRVSPALVTQQFVYDDARLCVQTDPLGAVEQWFGYRPDRCGNGRLLSQWSAANGLQDFQFDAQHATAQLVSAAAVDGIFRYRAFGLNPAGTQAGGETDLATSIVPLTRFGFGGEPGTLLDADAQLYWIGDRWFDPFTGQFLSPRDGQPGGAYTWPAPDPTV